MEQTASLATPSEPATAPKPARPRISAQNLRTRLAADEPDRWLRHWADGLSHMSAGELWALATDPALANQAEVKVLRESLVRGCLVASSYWNIAEAKPGLVDDWCREFKAMGGSQFLGEQSRQLMFDPDLLSATSKVLGARKLRGTQTEKDEELAMLEAAFRNAVDPWALRASTRSLWQYNSPTLSQDWPRITALSRFQQSRIGEFAAAEAACRSTGDCDAASPWLVELCALMPGIVCPSGANIETIVAQNLSPTEAAILRDTVTRALAVRAGTRPRG